MRTPPLPLLSAAISLLYILAQVNNSAKLPLFLLGAVKDHQELAQGHVPGLLPTLSLKTQRCLLQSPAP